MDQIIIPSNNHSLLTSEIARVRFEIILMYVAIVVILCMALVIIIVCTLGCLNHHAKNTKTPNSSGEALKTTTTTAAAKKENKTDINNNNNENDDDDNDRTDDSELHSKRDDYYRFAYPKTMYEEATAPPPSPLPEPISQESMDENFMEILKLMPPSPPPPPPSCYDDDEDIKIMPPPSPPLSPSHSSAFLEQNNLGVAPKAFNPKYHIIEDDDFTFDDSEFYDNTGFVDQHDSVAPVIDLPDQGIVLALPQHLPPPPYTENDVPNPNTMYPNIHDPKYN